MERLVSWNRKISCVEKRWLYTPNIIWRSVSQDPIGVFFWERVCVLFLVSWVGVSFVKPKAKTLQTGFSLGRLVNVKPFWGCAIFFGSGIVLECLGRSLLRFFVLVLGKEILIQGMTCLFVECWWIWRFLEDLMICLEKKHTVGWHVWSFAAFFAWTQVWGNPCGINSSNPIL